MEGRGREGPQPRPARPRAAPGHGREQPLEAHPSRGRPGLRREAGSWGLEQARPEQTQRRVSVAMLTTLGLAADGDTRGQMREDDGALRLVAVLAAGPAAPAGAPLELGGRNHQRGVLGLLEDGHRHGAGVHAAALFRRRDALPAMTPGLVLEDAGRVGAAGPEDDNARALLELLQLGSRAA